MIAEARFVFQRDEDSGERSSRKDGASAPSGLAETLRTELKLCPYGRMRSEPESQLLQLLL
jgi:hypothetical protein